MAVRTKEQIVYDLLFNQKITPEEAEVLMQDIEWWRQNPNTWVAPNDLVTPVYPVPGPTCDSTGMYQFYFDPSKQAWIANN